MNCRTVLTYISLQKNCENHPWMIEPGLGQYLYVKVHGKVMTNFTKCATTNRIVLHTGGRLHVSVCPKPLINSRNQIVEVFSDGWAVTSRAEILPHDSNPFKHIAVEFIIEEPTSYTVTWLELSRRLVSIFPHNTR